MTERSESTPKSKKRRAPKGPSGGAAVQAIAPPPPVVDSGAATERALGRAVRIGLPLVTLAAAVVVTLTRSFGSALLVMVGGALLGAVALLWASVRTLGGDAPLSEAMQQAALRRYAGDELHERKRRALRALKDLEHEHAVGKIDSADYAQLAEIYRNEAKDILRELDAEIDPLRLRAEKLVAEHMRRRGVSAGQVVHAPPPEDEAEDDRRTCPKCETSNEPDAAFCKKCGTGLEGASLEGREESTDAPA